MNCLEQTQQQKRNEHSKLVKCNDTNNDATSTPLPTTQTESNPTIGT